MVVPQPAEYAALGAARQAAWALGVARGTIAAHTPPAWRGLAEVFESGQDLPAGQAVRKHMSGRVTRSTGSVRPRS